MILLQYDGPLATVTLNRPQRHNSLVPELLEALLEALDDIPQHPEARAVVLNAKGRSFSTGGDVGAFYEQRHQLAAYANRLVGLLNQAILALIELPVPVVAAVHGLVTGGSLGLVLGSDIVIVAPETSFSAYYNVVGFSPDGGWSALLPGMIGLRRASEALLANRSISAQEAVAWGLANRLVSGDEIQATAREIAQSIAVLQPRALASSKRLLAGNVGELANALEAERARFVEQIDTPEARQGIAAFLGLPPEAA